MPRVRGLGSSDSFGHPFLDAWFARFPRTQSQYGGAAVGEIDNVASRIDERKGASWIAGFVRLETRARFHALRAGQIE